MPSAYLIDGPLDLTCLQKSFSALVRRHESLRTYFDSSHGTPFQVVIDPFDVDLELADLSNLSRDAAESRALLQIDEACLLPFDLTTCPLFRVQVFRLSRDAHILFVGMHHAISDGWSKKVMLDELSALYKSFASGTHDDLPQPQIQYGDFAEWQHEWFRGDVIQKDLAHWIAVLDGYADLVMPRDIGRDVEKWQGESVDLVLSPELTKALKTFSSGAGATPFMTLLATFKMLLFRHTGQEDIIIGAPVSGRQMLEVEQTLGLFLNMIPLRTTISRELTFRELLETVRDVNLNAYVRQNMPFEKLVEALRPERDLERDPIIQSMINYIPSSWRLSEFAGMPVKRLHLKTRTARFPLSLYIAEDPEGFLLQLVYQAAIFSQEKMRSLLDQYDGLIRQVLDHPDRRISSYSLVTARARRLLPNPTRVLDAPLSRPVYDQFVRWVDIAPESVAISVAGQDYSYQQLLSSSEQVSSRLLAGGVQPGDVISVSGLPSYELVSSALGVLRSKGVLMLIDPELPEIRKRLMLQQARTRFMITVSGENIDVVRRDQESDQHAHRTLSQRDETGTGRDSGNEAGLESGPAFSSHDSGDSAYIFFTSGTTGLPKGIVGSHAGLSHFIDWQRDTFNVGPSDRVALLTSLSFDPVLRDIFLPLTSGGTLCLPSIEDRYDHTAIVEWLIREKISMVHAVPTMADQWLSSSRPSSPDSSLRYVFFAGEPLQGRIVKKWRQIFPTCDVVNLYGPTETTLVKCWYKVPVEVSAGIQPIGSPLPNTQVLIMGHEHQLCGFGETGEIVIRTPFRSRGYLAAASGHEKAFSENPFTADKDDLLYRTGDLGSYRTDGLVEILGRKDDQIKIRGVRIEPAEVAANLLQHRDVVACFATGSKNADNETVLIVYIVPRDNQPPDISVLRTYLSERIPPAMIPSAFVFLTELPITPNGKIDRNALPQPVLAQPAREVEYVPPRSSEEIFIASIWEEILHVERIGVHQNFFDLGGHSLAAVQVINRIRKKFDIEMPLRVIFEAQTVAELAAVLTE